MILDPKQEPRGANLSFKKWRRVVDATPRAHSSPPVSLEEHPISLIVLNDTNTFFNDQRRFKYVKDKKDYYLTLAEFLSAGRDAPKGRDCEDYAIAKRTKLINMGASERNLRLVAVRDTFHRRRHMVLAVFNGRDGIFILDNTIKGVVKAKRLKHYKPIFALSDNYYWRF